MDCNDNLLLIVGKSGKGKSSSLQNIENPEGVIYLNCENSKKLPFRDEFMKFNVTDPLQVNQAFEEAEDMPDVHTIVVDTLTFMMDMFESVYVRTALDGQSAWGDYFSFFKVLMSKHVAKSTKTVIFTSHTADIYNEKELAMETIVKVKGSLMNNGIEAFFSTIVSCKTMLTKELKNYNNSLMTITEEELDLGFKYVYQTRINKETVGERIRSPMGMWTKEETFIDNNAQLVLNRLREYYK